MKSSLNLVLLLSFFVTLISPHQAWSVINLTEEECKATNLDQASQDFCDKLCKVADIPACSPHNEAPDACNGFCCPGTKLVGGVCKDPSIIDQGISRCKTNADCGGGMGCFDAENDETAMFLSQSQNPADVDEQEKQHDDMDSERDAPEGKDIGAKCNLHRECKTFLCEKLTPGRKVEPTCSPKGICRLGNVGDAAPGSIQCEPNLIKPQGICQPKQMDALLIPAPITDANPIDTGKCQFELPAQVKNNAIFAMKSVRAMEWLFATSAVGPGDECIGATTYMKEIIIKDYLDKRKDLLKNFNVKLNQLEKDYILLVAAKKGSTLPVSIHESDKDLPDENGNTQPLVEGCLLYPSDAADD